MEHSNKQIPHLPTQRSEAIIEHVVVASAQQMTSTMASVLVVYKEFPAPSVGHAGGKAVFQVIEFLHQRGHRVCVVARLRQEERPLIKELARSCDRMYTVPHHRALAGLVPVAFVRSYLALRRTIARALEEIQPDFLHIEVTQTAFVLLGLRRPFTSFRPLDVNWFLLQQQATHMRGTHKALARIASRVLHRVEPWLCRRFDLIATISEGDQRLLAPYCESRPLLILPLAPSFSPRADAQPPMPPGLNVLFVGAMYRTFNVQGVQWFLERVWPTVLARVPQAHFYIVGYDPPQQILNWHGREHVSVIGFAEDLAPWYQTASLFVSPLLVGGGLLQKVVDALAAGAPVVATSVSNHGVGATPGEHLLTADTPADFAEAVVRLLKDQAERERLARAGQQFAHTRYNLKEALAHWEAIWLEGIALDQKGSAAYRAGDPGMKRG